MIDAKGLGKGCEKVARKRAMGADPMRGVSSGDCEKDQGGILKMPPWSFCEICVWLSSASWRPKWL